MTNVITLTEANFDEQVLQSDVPVIVDYWAPWCGPCRMLGPVIEQIADERSGTVKVGKVNVDDEPSLPTAPGSAESRTSSSTATASPPRRRSALSPRPSSSRRSGLDSPVSGVKLSALLEPQIWLEEGTQLHAPAMQAALERRLADADDLGRIVRR